MHETLTGFRCRLLYRKTMIEGTIIDNWYDCDGSHRWVKLVVHQVIGANSDFIEIGEEICCDSDDSDLEIL